MADSSGAVSSRIPRSDASGATPPVEPPPRRAIADPEQLLRLGRLLLQLGLVVGCFLVILSEAPRTDTEAAFSILGVIAAATIARPFGSS